MQWKSMKGISSQLHQRDHLGCLLPHMKLAGNRNWSVHGQREGEAEYDNEGDEVGATDGVDDVADTSFHPKVVWLHVYSSA